MWFRSVFLKSLRDHRVAILGWGIGMGLVVASPMASVGALVTTPQARAELVGIASTFAWNADAVAVDTIGGYATWKIGVFIFLIATWPLLAGSRMLRGEEDRGSLDMLLAQPRPRARVAIEKLAAMWTALLLMGVLIALVTYAGGRAFGADFSPVDAVLFGLDLALFCAVVGGIALVLSQFTEERGPAAGWTAGLLLVFIVMDMVHRVTTGADWVSQLSPVYYYNLSKPLIPSYGSSAGGMLLLLGLALLLDAAGTWLFLQRDVGGIVPLPRWLRLPRRAASTALPEGDWSLRSVYTRSLGMTVAPGAWWTLGIAGCAAWLVFAVQLMETRLSGMISASPAVAEIVRNVGGGDVGMNAGFLSAMFVFLPMALMAFAVTQVNRWSADEHDGRLELVLATPQSRLTVLLGRFGALATACVLVALATLAAMTVSAAVAGLTLDLGDLAAATLGMIPLALLVAAIGYLAAGWLRTAADTGLLSFLLAGWFIISFVGPELHWPEATLRLSAFYYYGSPLIHGLEATSVAGLVVVAGLALAAGAWRFTHKDIAV
ncbi:MAG: polyether ionophore transport system permease protein [Chloroflexota bacterium]|jgi:ABC-2 type transport system permease protein|nr:polyether ionophore transport system permease protein [Chloroflexota bacterium]